MKDCKWCRYYMTCNYNQIGLGSCKWAKECVDFSKTKKFGWEHRLIIFRIIMAIIPFIILYFQL